MGNVVDIPKAEVAALGKQRNLGFDLEDLNVKAFTIDSATFDVINKLGTNEITGRVLTVTPNSLGVTGLLTAGDTTAMGVGEFLIHYDLVITGGEGQVVLQKLHVVDTKAKAIIP